MYDDKCLTTNTHSITFEGEPTLGLVDEEVCEGIDVVFDVLQEYLTIANYDWSTGASTPDIIANMTGDYVVEITGFCDVIIDSVYLNVVPCEVPNVITPNNDGVNDFFYTRFAELHDDVSLTIFNRWGTIIYETISYDNGWNGQRKDSNQRVKSGTYFYLISWDGGTQNSSGTVTVFD